MIDPWSSTLEVCTELRLTSEVLLPPFMFWCEMTLRTAGFGGVPRFIWEPLLEPGSASGGLGGGDPTSKFSIPDGESKTTAFARPE